MRPSSATARWRTPAAGSWRSGSTAPWRRSTPRPMSSAADDAGGPAGIRECPPSRGTHPDPVGVARPPTGDVADHEDGRASRRPVPRHPVLGLRADPVGRHDGAAHRGPPVRVAGASPRRHPLGTPSLCGRRDAGFLLRQPAGPDRYVYEDDQVFLRRLPADVRAELEEILVAQALPIETQLQWYFDDLLLETGGNGSDDVRVQLAPANLHWCSDAALTAIADRGARQRSAPHASPGDEPTSASTRLAAPAAPSTTSSGSASSDPALTLKDMACGSASTTSNHRLERREDLPQPQLEPAPAQRSRAPVNAFLSKGVSVAVQGIDEAGLNDERDMLLEARLALHLHGPPGDGSLPARRPTTCSEWRRRRCPARPDRWDDRTARRPGFRADVPLSSELGPVAYPYLDEAIGVVDAVMRRAKPSIVRSIIVGAARLPRRAIHASGRGGRPRRAQREAARPLPDPFIGGGGSQQNCCRMPGTFTPAWLDGEPRRLPR